MREYTIAFKNSDRVELESQNTEKAQRWNHTITRVETSYMGFVCSAQPKMELLTAEIPKRCPVCREIKPIKDREPEGEENF